MTAVELAMNSSKSVHLGIVLMSNLLVSNGEGGGYFAFFWEWEEGGGRKVGVGRVFNFPCKSHLQRVEVDENAIPHSACVT